MGAVSAAELEELRAERQRLIDARFTAEASYRRLYTANNNYEQAQANPNVSRRFQSPGRKVGAKTLDTARDRAVAAKEAADRAEIAYANALKQAVASLSPLQRLIYDALRVSGHCSEPAAVSVALARPAHTELERTARALLDEAHELIRTQDTNMHWDEEYELFKEAYGTGTDNAARNDDRNPAGATAG